MTDETKGAQAPTPGPLSGNDVKLLVKGDWISHPEHGTAQYWPSAAGDRCLTGPWSFVGRPDADGWIDHKASDAPPPEYLMVEYITGSGLTSARMRVVELRWDRDFKWRPSRLAPTAPVEASGSEREAVTHEVKCWREPFAAVKSGAKPWELRLNDRDYRVGDTLRQFEWNEAENCYTGDEVSHRIGWALHGPAFGLPEGYVIMTLEALRPQPSGETREWLEKPVNIGCPTDEPSLREMIEHYYRSHTMPEPTMWTERYVDALSPAPVASGGQHSSGPEHPEGFGPETNVFGEPLNDLGQTPAAAANMEEIARQHDAAQEGGE